MPPVNTLANVNISLQQFQDISCGKFNAGEVRLRGANGLDKMNDHVDRRGLNQETISHAEVIAIKQSLVKVLDAVTKGRELPPTPYYSPISASFAEMDCTADGGPRR